MARESADVLVAETWERTLELKFAKLVLATGARERFLPFPGWTLPGAMGAGGLQALVKSGLSISGKRVVIAGSGPLLLAVAEYLRRAGAEVLLIAEQSPAGRVRGFAARLLLHPANVAGDSFEARAWRDSLSFWNVAGGCGRRGKIGLGRACSRRQENPDGRAIISLADFIWCRMLNWRNYLVARLMVDLFA